ncbi:putative sulfate exporter family transporter [Campylobacter sp. FMV-PI01]|uniref:Putative sulfate exporter family transporter n=1 Tax=Campylobacter portucalensis TaxID=2608384 RepID=A0A6L5WF52_9BACT|nr:putative sulfate exporter family transporter [Campylobacter portucalensis]MSN95618.1 putative sulfate exporter family transporter [Campylobacter portucalensis]
MKNKFKKIVDFGEINNKNLYIKRKIKAWMFVFLSSFCAYLISIIEPFKTFAISSLIISVVIGVIIGNLFKKSHKFLGKTGVLSFSTKQILRLGIILYGFKITLNDIAVVGLNGILFAFFIVFSTFFLGCFVGKLLGIDKKTSVLVSAGSSICGAAAVLATSSTIKAKSEQIAIAICTVVVFGSIFMFAYPILFNAGLIPLSQEKMGYMVGLSIHEVAHAVAAGAGVGAGDISVIIKMLRVLMLVPFLIMLGIFIKFFIPNGQNSAKFEIPYFAFLFLLMIVIGSFIPENLRLNLIPVINFIDTILLSIAMFCLGFGIRKDILKHSSKKPFLLAIILAIWLILASFILVYFFVR